MSGIPKTWFVYGLSALCLFVGCAEPITDSGANDKAGGQDVRSKDGDLITDSPTTLDLGQVSPLRIAIDEHRGDVRAWAHVTRIQRHENDVSLQHYRYDDTSVRNDFWPASTIKMYTATAALELLTQWEMSLDAVATFYHEDPSGGWVEDVSISFRELVRRTFDCSSNITYTLLLRLGGIDWLNGEFFPSRGMHNTALMRGYVPEWEEPYGYARSAAQRIIIRDDGREVERTHQFSGRAYADEVGCSILNETGTANCTTPFEMSEHLRKIMMHETLPESAQFAIRSDLLEWYRGNAGALVLNNTEGDDCGGPVYRGIQKVFDAPRLHHKEGLVSDHRGTIHYVHDPGTNTEYVVGLMLNSPSERLLAKISEEIGRVMRDRDNYVHLATIQDYVNPIEVNLTVSSDRVGELSVLLKPYEQEPTDENGWFTTPTLVQAVQRGTTSIQLTSGCIAQAGTYHVKGVLRDADGTQMGISDLHYVIVEPTASCPPED